MAFSLRDYRQGQNSLGSMGGNGQMLTELGDPNFSPSMGSQAQVPAAAAQSRIFDNQRRAQNQIETAMSMGYDVADPSWEPVHQQADTGFIQDAGSFVGSLVGWIDGPRQAINLFIQDMVGGQAPEGFDNPNFGDYWNAFWGGVEDPETFEAETGLNPMSGSKTLDMFGWAEEDELDVFGRVTRGVADFGLQVLTDPLTYVTFGLSALGKKTAMATATAFQKAHVNNVLQAVKKGTKEGLGAYDARLFDELGQITDEFQEVLMKAQAKHGGELPPDMRDAVSRYFGREDAVWTNLGEAALANRIGAEVMQPLMNRSFRKIDKLALDELPAWARGGARISVPFTQSTLSKGYLIPGTQGLGRQLVGDPMRALSQGLKTHAPGYEYLADQIKKGVSKFDQQAPLTRALAKGDIEGWQWNIAMTAVDNMHNNVAKHTIATEINAHWNRLNDFALAENVDLADIGADIFYRLEGDNISESMLDQVRHLSDDAQPKMLGQDRITPEMRQAIDETVTYMQKTMESYHEALAVLDPTFRDKFIKGYIPHMPSKEGRAIMSSLAGTKAGTAGTGDAKADLLAQMINASGGHGVAEAGMGTNLHETRSFGRMNVLRHNDDGPLMVDRNALGTLADDPEIQVLVNGVLNEDAIELRYLPVPVLNRMLEPMVREAATKYNIPLPRNWDGKIFNENPIDTMLDYVNSMSDTIQAWSTIDALRASGLAFNHSTELDIQQVIQKMMGNLVANSARMPTVKAGRPVEGETTQAPTDWLMKIVDPENARQARGALAKGPLDKSDWAAKNAPDEALGGPLGATDLDTGAVRLDRAAIDSDYKAGLAYLKGSGAGDSHNKTRIFEELGRDIDELREQLDAIGGVEAYEEFIMRHEQWHVANPNKTGFDAEKAATQQALDWLDTQPTHSFGMGKGPGGKPQWTTNPQEFKESIAETGVRDAVVVEVYPDGMPQLANGHHRVIEAHDQGISQIPVVFRRAVDEDFRVENGIRIGDNLQSNWWDAGRKGGNPIYDEIAATPENFVYHATSTQSAASIGDKPGTGSLKSGGFYRDRADAEALAADRRLNEAGDATVLIFRVDTLPPYLQRELADTEKNPQGILDAFSGGKDPNAVTPIRPVARYNTADGFESLGGTVDALTNSEGWEALKTTPWGPTIIEDGPLNLLHGGKNPSSLPGVSRSVEMQINDTEVMKWASLEDVAETRRLHGRLTSTTEEDWVVGIPNTPLEISYEPPNGAAWHWQDETFDDGTQIKVFDKVEPEPGLGSKEAAERAKLSAEKIKEAKAARRKAQKEGAEPPAVTMAVRGSTGPTDAPKLEIKFNPYASKGELKAARRAAIHQLDREFKEGGQLAGMFTDTGFAQLIESGMDRTTANVLRDYAVMKLGTLGRDAVEFISKEPAEIFAARALFDTWQNGINDFVKAYSARVQDGRMIVDTEKVAILGTKEVQAQLDGLKRAAMELGDKGYDVAVKVMQDVDAYTGVQTMAGYVKPSHFNLSGPAVENLTIQQDIAEWLSLTARNVATMYTPEGVAAAKLATNETLKWWRAMATLPRPAFHIRNTVGGSWMNMNYGVQTKTMASVAKWGVIFRNALGKASGQEGLEQAFKALPAKEARAWRAMWDRNVLAGFATTEFSNAVTPAAKRSRWDWAKAWDVDNFALTRAGGKIMETTEDFMRASLFMQYYDEAVPGSADFAAALVNQVHFNYSNLTPTETKLKSFIPFFVWTRRNLPLQLSLAVENPRYVQRYRAMMQAMNDNLGGNDGTNLQEGDHFSAYAAGTNYKVNGNTPFWARVMIDPDLPIKDLLSIPDPEPGALIEYANNILGPHISLIGDINSQREMGDVNAPAPFNAVLQSLAAIGMYDRTMDGDVRIPYHLRTLMETFIPFTRELGDPLTGGATDPGRQQRMGIAQDDGFVESSVKSLAGQLAGGFGVKLTTPTDTRSAAYRSDDELSEIIESLRLQGKAPLPPQN